MHFLPGGGLWSSLHLGTLPYTKPSPQPSNTSLWNWLPLRNLVQFIPDGSNQPPWFLLFCLRAGDQTQGLCMHNTCSTSTPELYSRTLPSSSLMAYSTPKSKRSENRRQQVGRTPGSGRVREQETTGRSLFLCSFYPMSNLLSSRFSRKSTSAAPGRLCLNTHPCQSGTNSSACYTFPQ